MKPTMKLDGGQGSVFGSKTLGDKHEPEQETPNEQESDTLVDETLC